MTWYCKKCGSDKVETKAWVDINTDDVIDYVTDDFKDADTFCCGCQEPNMGVTEEKPEEEVDEDYLYEEYKEVKRLKDEL